VSIKVIDFVWRLNLPTKHKIVALALADHAHEDGSEARPSQALLSDKTGISDRHIRRILTDLLGWGVIETQRPAGQHRATTYRIVMTFPDRTPVSTLKLSRPDKSASRPDKTDAQTGHPCPTNRKEPLLEPLPNLKEIAERNRQILRGMK
jgi:hypothetical protein